MMKITGILGIAAAGTLAAAASAQAASVGFTLDDGADLTFNVLLSEVAGGDIQFDVAVAPGGDVADLRGIFFDVANESLLTGFSVALTGGVTDTQFNANSVSNLGNGANMNGAGVFDAGVEIGTSGLGGDEFQSVTFVLAHTSANLSLNDFMGQAFGIRATSVGPVGSNRGGSVKLTGTSIPTPAAAGMGLALLGLGALRRTRRDAA